MTATATRVKTYPIIEVFGPTVQGEGPDAGRPCYFIRMGGCDYRCSWCDSMYAVEPKQVKENAEKLTTGDILDRVVALPGSAEMVVISGGNPALLELGELVHHLQGLGYKVAVETQGSLWKRWLGDVDRLVISPKPPSSGMVDPVHAAQTARFIKVAMQSISGLAIKIVVFDDIDYQWALEWRRRHTPFMPLYLSAGTTQEFIDEPDFEKGMVDQLTQDAVCDRYGWLCEKVANDPRAAGVIALPQLHVLAFGTGRAV